jgi:uncharacterized protein (DUF3820 family)
MSEKEFVFPPLPEQKPYEEKEWISDIEEEDNYELKKKIIQQALKHYMSQLSKMSNYEISFGKHKGTTFKDLWFQDERYCLWYYKQNQDNDKKTWFFKYIKAMKDLRECRDLEYKFNRANEERCSKERRELNIHPFQ